MCTDILYRNRIRKKKLVFKKNIYEINQVALVYIYFDCCNFQLFHVLCREQDAFLSDDNDLRLVLEQHDLVRFL